MLESLLQEYLEKKTFKNEPQGSFRSTAEFQKNNFNEIISTYYKRGDSCFDDPEIIQTNC